MQTLFLNANQLGSFEEFALNVRSAVNQELEVLLSAQKQRNAQFGPAVTMTLDAAASLALRGGKRLRAILIAAAYRATGGNGELATVLPAGVAIELLQTSLLIHDDWIDGDQERRGGPSVHVELRTRCADEVWADALAVLAGDHMTALAGEILQTLPLAPEVVGEAMRLFSRMQQDVLVGQILDVTEGEDVEGMYDLKTGSYTVRGPLALGATLAGASAEAHRTLEEFARPLGMAFQLRDDLLGTFGDPRALGKPVRADILRGKRTALVRLVEAEPGARSLLQRVLGNPSAQECDVQALLNIMVESGAKARIERRIEELTEESRRALRSGGSALADTEILGQAVDALAQRRK